MDIAYPITITNYSEDKIGQAWNYLSQPVSIILETDKKEVISNVVTISIGDDSITLNERIVIPIVSFSFAKANEQSAIVSLRDNNDVRLTNYTGYDKKKGWMKFCWGCCDKRVISSFGNIYPIANGTKRDNSYCGLCKNCYKCS